MSEVMAADGPIAPPIMDVTSAPAARHQSPALRARDGGRASVEGILLEHPSTQLRATGVIDEPLAIVVVSLMLSGGFLLAWQMLCRLAPGDDSLGWVGIAFRTNAVGTATVAAVAAIRALASLWGAIRSRMAD